MRSLHTALWTSRSIGTCCVSVAALLLVTAALAADLPTFRKGLWEFNRTVRGQSQSSAGSAITSKQCTDPSADMKEMNAMLSKQGCKFSEVIANGNVYTFSSQCKIQSFQSQTRSVITTESDSAFTVQVTGTTDGQSTNETLRAKRVGDC